MKSATSKLQHDTTALQDALGILLTGLALGAWLQHPLVAGTALVLSLAVAVSARPLGLRLQTEPAKAETDLKTLGETR